MKANANKGILLNTSINNLQDPNTLSKNYVKLFTEIGSIQNYMFQNLGYLPAGSLTDCCHYAHHYRIHVSFTKCSVKIQSFLRYSHIENPDVIEIQYEENWTENLLQLLDTVLNNLKDLSKEHSYCLSWL